MPRNICWQSTVGKLKWQVEFEKTRFILTRFQLFAHNNRAHNNFNLIESLILLNFSPIFWRREKFPARSAGRTANTVPPSRATRSRSVDEVPHPPTATSSIGTEGTIVCAGVRRVHFLEHIFGDLPIQFAHTQTVLCSVGNHSRRLFRNYQIGVRNWQKYQERFHL